jgi:hypothetical protein
MKVVLRIGAALALLAVVAWSSTYLYWRYAIKRAIRTLEVLPLSVVDEEDNPADVLAYQRAYATLMAGGARSLPYLIEALESSPRPWLISDTFMKIIHLSTLDRDRQQEDRHLGGCLFTGDETMSVRRKRMENLRAWWAHEGYKHHPGWRIWSSNCRPLYAGSE